MFDIIKKEMIWGNATLILETGKIARQATAAVTASLGETVVLCTVVGSKEADLSTDFFPLTVNYQEKFYAAGKIPGGFIKRETKPSEREVLTSRLIDRPIRPLFPDGYRNAVQVICTVLSYDGVNDPDILSIIAASAALKISGIPFQSTIAAARVGYKDGAFVLNEKNPDALLELIVAGTSDSILMVESEAKELSESVMLEAILFGQKSFADVITLIDQFVAESKVQAWDFTPALNVELVEKMTTRFHDEVKAVYSEPRKKERVAALSALYKNVVSAMEAEGFAAGAIKAEFNTLCESTVRSKVLKEHVRIDSRKLDEIRPIACELDLLPRAHGSALFTRGETQALVVTTIGTSQDEQMADDLLGNRSDRFMLHYNFPPYSVGEISSLRAPGRREIGHGKLALKALSTVVPSKDLFGYTIRLVSEITESNGSSSMATVCGASLSLMAAGVPITSPVAGIAMGLIKEGDDFAVLSDIMGDEDYLGDMDFKVAGTTKGITALQMDIKTSGISEQIMQVALSQALKGLNHIIEEMLKTIKSARNEISQYAPRVVSMQIDKDKIREVIGSGGKVIRDICEKSGAKVDIEDSGKINIAAVTEESRDIAIKMISEIIAVPEMYKTYTGPITKLASFGAFVKFLGATEGLLHISEVANERIAEITDVLTEGQVITVQVIGIEPNGKVRLSMKSLLNNSGERPEGSSRSSQSSDDAERSQRRYSPRDSGSSHGGGGSRYNDRRSGGGDSRSSDSRGGDSRGGSRFGGSDRGGERSPRRSSDGSSSFSKGRSSGGSSYGGGNSGGGGGGGRKVYSRSSSSDGGSRDNNSFSDNRGGFKDQQKRRRFF